eukprot:SAG31_NODE_25701_length_456_cov_0.857143_1_plen_54_part_10
MCPFTASVPGSNYRKLLSSRGEIIQACETASRNRVHQMNLSSDSLLMGVGDFTE